MLALAWRLLYQILNAIFGLIWIVRGKEMVMKPWTSYIVRLSVTMIGCCFLMSCGSSSGGSAAPQSTPVQAAPVQAAALCEAGECNEESAPVSAQQVCDVFNGLSDASHNWSDWQAYVNRYLSWLSDNVAENKSVGDEIKTAQPWRSYYKIDTDNSYLQLVLKFTEDGEPAFSWRYIANTDYGTPERIMTKGEGKVVHAYYAVRNSVTGTQHRTRRKVSLIMPICIHKINKAHLEIVKGWVALADRTAACNTWHTLGGFPATDCNTVNITCPATRQASDVICRADKKNGLWTLWQVPAGNSSQSIKIWNAYKINKPLRS